MKQLTIPLNEFQDMYFYAFRYALGRTTSAPDTVAEHCIKRIKCFDDYHLNRICKEIDEAIERKAAGMECDVKTWQKLRNEANTELMLRLLMGNK